MPRTVRGNKFLNTQQCDVPVDHVRLGHGYDRAGNRLCTNSGDSIHNSDER